MTNNIKVSSAGTKTVINASTPQNYYDGLAKQWAISNSMVQGQDYSSKYYAGKSKEEFTKTQAETQKAQSASKEAKSYANLADEIIEDGKTAIDDLEKQAEINIENKKDELSLELKNEKTTYLNEVKSASQTAINTYSNVLTKKQITNCLTEIPQNIKLELKDGALTLKKGSKVIIDNSYYTVPADAPVNLSTVAGQKLMFYEKNRNFVMVYPATSCASGDTLPASGGMFYLTTEKSVYRYTNNAWTKVAGYSLPLGSLTQDASSVTALGKPFDGGGCIGNTIWADKGILGLRPNGRNADGTLNNIEFETADILVQTRNISGSGILVLNATNFSNYAVSNYDADLNKNISATNTTVPYANVGTWKADSTGRITEFKFNTPFHAVDYNDFKKTQEQLNTTTSNVNNRYVVEKSAKSLLPSWYTVYSDGWIEQGGVTTTNKTVVTYLKPFSNTNYTINMTCTEIANLYEPPSCIDLTITSFTATRLDGHTDKEARWFACGY